MIKDLSFEQENKVSSYLEYYIDIIEPPCPT